MKTTVSYRNKTKGPLQFRWETEYNKSNLILLNINEVYDDDDIENEEKCWVSYKNLHNIFYSMDTW